MSYSEPVRQQVARNIMFVWIYDRSRENNVFFLRQLEGSNEGSILGNIKACCIEVLLTAGNKNDASFKYETSVIFGSRTILHISAEEAIQMATLRFFGTEGPNVYVLARRTKFTYFRT